MNRPDMELVVAPLSQIEVADRFREEYGDIDALILSMKKEGIIQPIAVKRLGDNSYRLLAGGRRYKAATQAGIVEIPLRVYNKDLSEEEMLSIELMENIARKELTWVEATNLKSRINDLQIAIHGKKIGTNPDAPGVSMRDTAKLLGVSIGSMSEDIKLSKALQVFPQLKEAKTKGDASKALKKLEEGIILAEIAKRQRNKIAETPLEVLHTNLINNYILKDFFLGVQQIPDRSIDIVEIDPPYGIDLAGTIKKSDDSTRQNVSQYNEIPVDQYVPFLNNLFKECYRVMSENSWIICWFGQEPWFEVVFQAMRRVGFQGNRIAAIWNKEGSSGQCNHPESYLAGVYEPFFYMHKGSPSITRQGRGNVFNYKPVSASRKIHPTERPIELIQDILQTFAWEGARLMVPFLGSGNTLLAAANLGIKAFGYDLSEVYRDGYTVNVAQCAPGSYCSYRKESI